MYNWVFFDCLWFFSLCGYWDHRADMLILAGWNCLRQIYYNSAHENVFGMYNIFLTMSTVLIETYYIF